MAMKKYKIGLGSCGGRAISTSIINAKDKRGAVIKYLESIGEEVTEEKISLYLPGAYEHIPKPRPKEEIMPLDHADIDRLTQICEDVVGIEESLMDGTISFEYDNLMSAMKPGHPAEILDNLFVDMYTSVCIKGKEPSRAKLEETLGHLRGFKKVFEVSELDKPIKELSEYIVVRKKAKSGNKQDTTAVY